MRKTKKTILAMNEANAAVLTEIIVGPQTSGSLQIQAMNKLLEEKESHSFFRTIFDENLSFGECPHCQHENHWCIDEDSLNVMGFVSEKEDPRVLNYTDEKSCSEFEQACKKKKITI